MPAFIDTPRPAGFHASVPLTLAERDILGWYFPFPTAQIPAPRPEPCLYIGRPDRCQCGICEPGQIAMWQVSR